jgi:hypothetical protein
MDVFGVHSCFIFKNGPFVLTFFRETHIATVLQRVFLVLRV